MEKTVMSRRVICGGAAAGVAAAALVSSTRASAASGDAMNNGDIHAPYGLVSHVNPIPEPAPQWKKLDLAEILSRPAAFCSVSQNKSVYGPGGVQSGENHRGRGSLEATIKVVQAARNAKNFRSFNWIGYPVFRQDYPQNDFDRAQYETWTAGLNWTAKQQAEDNELTPELRALVRPGDKEFNEMALQGAFFGTAMPLELTRKHVQVIVLCGIHMDWCIEGNARMARDNGYLPIVVADACGCQKPEEEPAAMNRINNFFAPVISSDNFVKLLNQTA